jgi:tetratricopeptide (TPR) repeat protein
MVHRGVIVESTAVFKHALNPEITILGQVVGDQIICRVEHGGWGAAQAANCSLELRPTDVVDRRFAEPYLGRGIEFIEDAAFGSALADLNESLRLNPNLPLALATRARILSAAPDARFRNGQLALRDATRACELTGWNEWECLPPLASACAENGDFASAVKYMNRAIRMAPMLEHQDLVDARDLYLNRTPMRLSD